MSSSDDEDIPLAQRVQQETPELKNLAAEIVPRRKATPGSMREQDSDDEDDDEEEEDAEISSSDDEDDIPLQQRVALKSVANGAKKRPRQNSSPAQPAKKSKAAAKRQSSAKDDKDIKWTTLEHAGVLFPPEYTPHGIKMKYDGVPVELTPDQEEVATMYASMIETDYMQKEIFLSNFWAEFKKVLGKNHVIRDLKKCDFRDIYDHLMAEREAKKNLPKEDKVKLKEEKDAAEARFKFALVDGRKEPVGNFRVEPPGLFRGRGEHPKMGKLKSRIYPRDITINIGKGVPVPQHPYPGQSWKEVRHDQTVTWLAFWKDPIDAKGYKYVWLGANSTFKTESDLAKYEKARKLKDHIERIRKDYQRLWVSSVQRDKQMSTALYFIDKLALRAGHEKDEDEADTVGCCTLKVDNVEMMSNNHIKFDFLGKDSIRYENQVEVDPIVWNNVKTFAERFGDGKKKSADDQLFDEMDANDLNKMMKDYMDGLSVKVFRTYNASITLNRLLWEESTSTEVVEKKADYDRANKEVAVLCNHQRAVPKTHEKSMQKMLDKVEEATQNLESLKKDYALAKANKPTQDGKNIAPDVLKKRVDAAKAKLDKLQVTMNSKEELKTVALGTSKINYLDPRITVAWCKRVDVPIEKVFNKSLHGKFSWAMEVEPEFKF